MAGLVRRLHGRTGGACVARQCARTAQCGGAGRLSLERAGAAGRGDHVRSLRLAVEAEAHDGCEGRDGSGAVIGGRSEEHTSELQSLMRISYAVFCLKKKNKLQQSNNYDTAR